MKKPELILIGSGGHSHACIDVVESEGRFGIGGLVGVVGEVGAFHMGYEVLATDDDMGALGMKFEFALITLGQIKSAQRRMHLAHLALESGFLLPTIISPFSRVSPHATIGPGTIVMHGAVVNAGAKIGSNCILNTNSVVEHDASLGDFVHISTGAVVNGNVTIAEGVFVGSRAVIKESLILGAGCLVGMGACVRQHLEANTKFVGSGSE